MRNRMFVHEKQSTLSQGEYIRHMVIKKNMRNNSTKFKYKCVNVLFYLYFLII